METTEPHVLRLPPSVGPADLPRLRTELTALMGRAGPGLPLVCDAADLARPTLAAVDALARLRLTAGRHGRTLVVSGAPPELRALLALTGLTALLGGPPPDTGPTP
ncbi:hypothetical protein C6N75_28590 [Streptomyces solincola]|uniref:MlaB-like STAS domain-containing protein n=1 Tax=Streptomyces solincola TaxID=2100817 RepID=A0A2S9PNC3_9ACTN|nr:MULTISPECIES: STAS domain-containing protein [Streptomyces]PRH75883.1 hypothetical protein C6N75_28590 [Streptomyces solincola]